MVDACAKAMEWEQLHSNHVAQAAAAASMSRQPREFQARMMADFQRARDTIYPLVRDVPEVQVGEPAGGPFLFCNVSAVFESSEDASRALLEAGVPTTPGHYCQSDRHVRMAFGASLEVLKKAGQRIEQVIAGRPAQSKGG
jgi:aspartate/methionine/tyrosine aminotransferase